MLLAGAHATSLKGMFSKPICRERLYDRWAKKYDAGKRESQLRDDEMLARPLLDLLKDVTKPFILDFATGTGRLSYALLNQEEFKGHIIALDLSQGMLEQAAVKLNSIGRDCVLVDSVVVFFCVS